MPKIIEIKKEKAFEARELITSLNKYNDEFFFTEGDKFLARIRFVNGEKFIRLNYTEIFNSDKYFNIKALEKNIKDKKLFLEIDNLKIIENKEGQREVAIEIKNNKIKTININSENFIL
jgi:hypothetical protein